MKKQTATLIVIGITALVYLFIFVGMPWLENMVAESAAIAGCDDSEMPPESVELPDSREMETVYPIMQMPAWVAYTLPGVIIFAMLAYICKGGKK